MAKAQGVVQFGQRIVALLAVLAFTWGTVGCAKPTEPTVLLSEPTEAPHLLAGPIAEVSPPETLDTLKQIIDAYTPQVRILSPRPGEVVESATVSVRFQVRGLPLFKDETWQLGPHLHVFLDDQPYKAVYDASEPLVLEDLAPGTHTLRVFASRPWHESFKNDGAFDQRTFHIFAPTPQNEVNASAPLLTYSRPQGSYGAEPIMLDFYLTNAPLHLTAQEDPKDDLHDWRIRCTVNGQSFVFDQWQPIYLKGFQPGRNWVQLELIDETGRPIDNRFNNTVRIIDYQPGGTDTLSRLVRGELDLKAVASIIDPTYTPPAPPEPEDKAVAEDEASPLEEPEAIEEPQPVAPEPVTPEPSEIAPSAAPADPEPAQAEDTTEVQAEDSAPMVTEEPEVAAPDSTAPDLESAAEDKALPATPSEVISPNAPPDTEIDTEIDTGTEADTDSQPDPTAAAATEDPKEDLDNEPAASDVAPQPDTLPDAASPESIQTQSQSQSQSQGIAPSETPVAKAKGMMKRWKNWAQEQTLPGFGASSPEPAPVAPPIPVYETPTSEPEPEVSTPSESSPSQGEAPTMVMPELIEPYLTQPYMTEPRLEFQPAEVEPFAESETEALKQSTMNGDDRGSTPVDPGDDEETPETEANEGTTPSDRSFFKRPYI
ncbi:MAG: hypothetical protein ACHWZW_06865 [Spirulina sp.]